jgi:2-hydroxychromene-2-carboxylate isomerase
MSKQIDYYYALSSPWTYLGGPRLEAIARQVFGAPTHIVDEEIFWGQDRLDFMETAFARS